MDRLPPRWVDVQDEVTELLADTAQKSAQLDKLHQKHLLPGFGDEDARKREEGVVERLTQDITRAFHDCQKAIQKIEMMVRDSKLQGAGVTGGEETMARNIQVSLAARVQEASARFRKKQSTYLKSKSQSSRLLEIRLAKSILFQNYEAWKAYHRPPSTAPEPPSRTPTPTHRSWNPTRISPSRSLRSCRPPSR